nr:hypothetical protein NG677_03905 [Methylobacterium sp. OTU13CASTA1]
MRDDPVSATASPVPKEKLDDVMTVRFKAGAFARIDGVAGKNRRAKFIREAVEEALRQAEKRKAKAPATEP